MINFFKKVMSTRILHGLLILIMFTGLSPSVVLSLSSADLNSIYNDTVWYKPDNGTSSSGVPGGITDCSLSSSSPGNGAPDGAQFPNLDPTAMANAINKWIVEQNPNSTLKGLGTTIVASSQRVNVSPFLIVGIAKKESSMGDPSDYNVKTGNNAYGREATSSQPNFPSPTKPVLWYKWSSAKASVDSSAPENQNAVGGGDMASYLRVQYANQIDNNNFIAFFMAYAPPKENDTAKYIAQVQSWIDELVRLTGQGTSSSSGGGNTAILCEAEKYNGIYYLFGGGHNGYSTFRQNCPEDAISSAATTSTASSQGPCATDCSGLVNVAVDAIYNQDYNWTVDSNGRMSGAGEDKWVSVPIAQAQPGDIVTVASGEGHVEIVMSVNGGSIDTFGSHFTGTQTGKVTTSTSYWTGGAWRWAGP